MKKIFYTLIFCFFLSSLSAFAIDEAASDALEVDTYSNEKNLFGLKDSNGNIVVNAQYKKLIRLGDGAWIVQKRNRFGLIDSSGNILIAPKYRHVDRFMQKYVKLGNYSDFGLYNDKGETIIPAEYSKIDPMFGGLFLTCKNYKYGIINSEGKVILENEFDDIYMPDPKTLRIRYEGLWYDIERITEDQITLPENARQVKVAGNNLKITNVIADTGIISGYGALTAADYTIKIFSSISPAYEQTIDELMLSQGAETVSIFMKLGWLPLFPFTYAKKYIDILREPYNGPLSEIRHDMRRQLNK